jgi:adenine phosphoribosyltransferase
MQAGGIQPGDSVIVIDDLIATGTKPQCPSFWTDLRWRLGGSAKAAGELVAKLGGIVVEYVFVIELAFLKGRDKLGSPVYSMLQSNE